MENYFIIGLGNPGKKYHNTRHNIGFSTIDYLSQKHSIDISKLKFQACIGEGRIDNKRIFLVKPDTYMNLSGESVVEMVNWHKAPLENIIIIYDDIDLAVGSIRIRPKGSAGTHNGMKSVIYSLKSDNFPRIRIGIGKPPPKWDLADYVLSEFREEEKEQVFKSIERAAEAVLEIINLGVDNAMNKYNVKGRG